MRSIGRIALLLATAALLGGCTFTMMQEVKKNYRWTEKSMLRDGWLDTRKVPLEPVFCYRTIADPDCYREAQLGERNRLIGYRVQSGEF